MTDRAKRAEAPIRRDGELILSSDVCQSGLEVTVLKRF